MVRAPQVSRFGRTRCRVWGLTAVAGGGERPSAERKALAHGWMFAGLKPCAFAVAVAGGGRAAFGRAEGAGARLGFSMAEAVRLRGWWGCSGDTDCGSGIPPMTVTLSWMGHPGCHGSGMRIEDGGGWFAERVFHRDHDRSQPARRDDAQSHASYFGAEPLGRVAGPGGGERPPVHFLRPFPSNRIDMHTAHRASATSAKGGRSCSAAGEGGETAQEKSLGYSTGQLGAVLGHGPANVM